MLFGDDKNMEPEDLKRLFLFFILATLLYVVYYNFVVEPQNKAMQEAARYEAIVAKKEAAIAQIEETAEPLSREEIIESVERVTIDNGAISGTIPTIGARIDDIALSEYYETLEKEDNIKILSPKGATLPRYVEYGWVPADKTMPVPNRKTQWQVRGNDKLTKDQNVTFTWDNGQGLIFERTYALDDHFMFTITQKVANKSGKKVTLYPYGLISQTGVPSGIQTSWLQHEGPIGYIGESLEEIGYDDIRKKAKIQNESTQGWIGITDKYWFSGLIPPQGQNVKYSFQYAGTRKDKNNRGRYQTDFLGAPIALETGQSSEVQSQFFAGAKEILLLNDYQDQYNIPKFELAVNFGWFWFLSKPFFYGLHYLGQLVGNMGLAIILLTIIIRGSVFPLMNASYRSFAKMKKVGPQVQALKERYGDDKQQMQQELMKLYQKEGVNPMAGCFPILLQIPIFFALYKVLFITIEIRHAPFFGWLQDLSAPDPTSVFNLFGLIPWDPPTFLHIGVLPCIMCVAMMFQKKLNPPPQDKIQRDIMMFFPFVITYVLSRFASGLVLYWTVSAIIGVIQQMIIMRSLNVPIYLFGQYEDEKAAEKGPDVHPMAAMAVEEAEDALFGSDDDDNPDPDKPIKPPKPKKSKKK